MPMKILTNIRSLQVSGIAQTLSSFANFVDRAKGQRVKIVGVDVAGKGPATGRFPEGSFSLISSGLEVPSIGETIRNAATIGDIERQYAQLVDTYRQAIIKEKPDVILINGTYYVPWCLLQASKDFSLPTILHYHGSITKETEHWPQAAHRELFFEMERHFDHPNLFYIFPSELTKTVVETEVFKHPIKKYSILPNPVPAHFFGGTPRGARKRIGVVGRWTRIKNPTFVNRLARYNAKYGGEYNLNIVSDLPNASKSRQDLAGLATFKRPMDNDRLSRFYSSMGVIVSPSHFETYGNVAKEALACGVPALVSSQMGVSETFRALGLEDWIVDFRSVRNVYAKIREIAGQNVPASVRDALRDQYGSDRIHGKMLNIIRSV